MRTIFDTTKTIYKLSLVFWVLLVFSVFMTPVQAKTTIDLQDYTTCNNEFCETRVDINKLDLNTLDKETLKKANSLTLSTKFDTKSIIYETNFKIDESYLIVSGKIQPNTNNYWTIEFNEFILDPWWNYTSVERWNHSASWTNHAAGGQNYVGANLTLSSIVTEIRVKKHVDAVPFSCHAVATDGTFIANGTYTDHICVLTQDFIQTSIRIVDNYSSSGNQARYDNSFTYPNSSVNSLFTWISCTIEDGSWGTCGATQFWDFTQINMTAATNLYYTTNLTLNSNESNVNIFNFTTLDTVAMSNLSTNITILINGTFYNTTIGTELSNQTYLPVGYYNVTAWFGNSSFNDTITYFANLTQYVAPTYFTNETYRRCSDNNTEHYHQAVYDNGTFVSSNNTYTLCDFGCNENNYGLGLCNPSPLFQVIILIISIICIYLLFRWIS